MTMTETTQMMYDLVYDAVVVLLVLMSSVQVVAVVHDQRRRLVGISSWRRSTVGELGVRVGPVVVVTVSVEGHRTS